MTALNPETRPSAIDILRSPILGQMTKVSAEGCFDFYLEREKGGLLLNLGCQNI